MQENTNTDIVLRQGSELEVSDEQLNISHFIPRTQLERLMEFWRDPSSDLPIHLRQLQELPLSHELKENLVNAYGNEAQKLARFMNREIECLGMVIWEVPAFMGKPERAGDPPVQKPGYYQVRILTSLEDENGNYVVLRSSSVNIATCAFFTLQNQRPWLFEKPIVFRFSETNGGAHTMLKAGESLKELKDLIKSKRGKNAK